MKSISLLWRTLIAVSVCFCCFFACGTNSSVSESYQVFVGTASGDINEGISLFDYDSESGSLQYKQKTSGILNPGYLTISPDQQFLYTIYAHRADGRAMGAVGAYRIEPQSGFLLKLNQQTDIGQGPCYITTDQTGKWILVANYGGGSVTSLPVLEDGGVGPVADQVKHTGASVNPERQKRPHAHLIRMDPQNRYAMAADLGTDKIMLYRLDQQTGKLSPNEIPFADSHAGAGPRHLDFHPTAEVVYVINELDGSITAFLMEYDSGNMTPFQTISTLPDTFTGYNKSADIHVHPSGRFLYGSNRGDFDSIAIFKIDAATGKLIGAGWQRDEISWPRNFAIHPAGEFMLVANRNSDSVVTFKIDQNSGALSPTGHSVPVKKPICVKFRKIPE